MSEPAAGIAAVLGACDRVTQAIAEHRRAIGELSAERAGLVRQLHALGLSQRAIGRMLGLSGPWVHQIIHERDVNPGRAQPHPARSRSLPAR